MVKIKYLLIAGSISFFAACQSANNGKSPTAVTDAPTREIPAPLVTQTKPMKYPETKKKIKKVKVLRIISG